MAELFYFGADFEILFSLISCFGTVGYFATLIGLDGGTDFVNFIVYYFLIGSGFYIGEAYLVYYTFLIGKTDFESWAGFTGLIGWDVLLTIFIVGFGYNLITVFCFWDFEAALVAGEVIFSFFDSTTTCFFLPEEVAF